MKKKRKRAAKMKPNKKRLSHSNILYTKLGNLSICSTGPTWELNDAAYNEAMAQGYLCTRISFTEQMLKDINGIFNTNT
jgi:hypothetical protein